MMRVCAQFILCHTPVLLNNLLEAENLLIIPFFTLFPIEKRFARVWLSPPTSVRRLDMNTETEAHFNPAATLAFSCQSGEKYFPLCVRRRALIAVTKIEITKKEQQKADWWTSTIVKRARDFANGGWWYRLVSLLTHQEEKRNFPCY